MFCRSRLSPKATGNGPPIEFAFSVTSVTLMVRAAIYLSTSNLVALGSGWTPTMSHEHDLVSIEQVIWRAKEQRAKDTVKICGPALKRLGGFALLAVLAPWQLVRQALANMVS
jgi:hypothetical protein